MSLINQMLKDLERRSKPKIKKDFALSELYISDASNVKNNKKIYFFLLYFILPIILFAIIFLVFDSNKSHPINNKSIIIKAPAFMSEEITKNNNTIENIEQHETGSAVTGLTLQIQNNMTSLRIFLSQLALYHIHYRVNKNNEKEYVITFDHTQLLSNVPTINKNNTALQNIRIGNLNNGNMVIILTLKEGAEINHLEVVDAKKYPELSIDISYKEKEVAMDNFPQWMSSNQQVLKNTMLEPIVLPNDTVLKQSWGSLRKIMINMSAEEEYQQAMQYLSQGLASKSMEVLSSMLSKFPNYDPARESLARLLVDEGKFLKAKDILQIGMKNRPYYYPYAELKARILVSEGQISDAINLLQKSAPTLKQDPEYHAFIAALYQRQGQFLLAARLYEQLLPYEPDNAKWWTGLGIAYENIGQQHDALIAYARAEQNENLNPELKAYVETRMHSLQ